MATRRKLEYVLFKKYNLFTEAVPQLNNQPISLVMSTKLKIVSVSRSVSSKTKLPIHDLPKRLRGNVEFLLSMAKRSKFQDLTVYSLHDVLAVILISALGVSHFYANPDEREMIKYWY